MGENLQQTTILTIILLTKKFEPMGLSVVGLYMYMTPISYIFFSEAARQINAKAPGEPFLPKRE